LTDTITANGCPGSCTLTVQITPCPPHITVYKQVVCVQPGGGLRDIWSQSSHR
jgi:hypothetical protein